MAIARRHPFSALGEFVVVKQMLFDGRQYSHGEAFVRGDLSDRRLLALWEQRKIDSLPPGGTAAPPPPPVSAQVAGPIDLPRRRGRPPKSASAPVPPPAQAPAPSVLVPPPASPAGYHVGPSPGGFGKWSVLDGEGRQATGPYDTQALAEAAFKIGGY